jgi:uncharacterized C2H2 Zn-finger protein
MPDQEQQRTMACSTCGMRFRTDEELRRHEREEHGSR